MNIIEQLRASLEHTLKNPYAISTRFSSTSVRTAAPIRPMIIVQQEVFEEALALLERLEKQLKEDKQ